jgi:hypothetical protein
MRQFTGLILCSVFYKKGFRVTDIQTEGGTWRMEVSIDLATGHTPFPNKHTNFSCYITLRISKCLHTHVYAIKPFKTIQ